MLIIFGVRAVVVVQIWGQLRIPVVEHNNINIPSAFMGSGGGEVRDGQQK